jgi:hypothetical protein
MTLFEIIPCASYDPSFGVWAKLIKGELQPESEARFGQLEYENGGLLDGFVFVCRNDRICDTLEEWMEYDGETGYGELAEGWFEELIDPLNEAKPWLGE